ncbi:hypothetical protein GCM10023149_13090 [Mucilaginibacter gynuensis]|uniref:HTH hxlR-type domain-containing protein n=1 Tax=Mucilaginibacter gynuensis TaxID=1302236 RepID=A0ABP8G2Z4_9SPHI
MTYLKYNHNSETCMQSIVAVRDALYVLSGKWKLPLIVALSSGPLRFKDIQRALEDITPKILSKELKELEINGFIERKVFATTPVTVSYELTPYSATLDNVVGALREWGMQHRDRYRTKPKETTVTEPIPETAE